MARKSKASVESTEVLSGENAIQNKEIEGLSQDKLFASAFSATVQQLSHFSQLLQLL